ncbi:MAG: hypothetical protein E7100_03720 [Bacteroidaceae bacterium]|nr:hypothetical protein [Bacteroidaceae bacterium]
MKKFKNLYTLAVLLLSGAAFTACTNDDFADKAMPQQGKTYTLSVNATKGADTRTLTEETDGSLTATWNLDDEVAVYLDGEKVGTLKPDNTEANALLTGDVTGVTVGDELDLVFSSDNYNSQEGTLEYIDANCNYAKATVEVTKIEGSDVYTSNAEFVNQQSITKFTFSEEVSKVVIYNGVDEITVTPTAATETLYVAIPATDGEADFTFTATVDGKTYIGEKSATLSNGKFYTATITLSALDEYTDLSAEATANTYMVTKAGKYKFNATVKGNGGIDPLTGTTANAITGIAGVKVLWELKDQGLAIKHDGTSYDIFYSDGYVYFSTPETFTSGDAYVAVYDSEGTILWSWLIWTTEEPTTTTYNDLVIMDRNLGQWGTGNGEYRGFCYEWGRKDPFPQAYNGQYQPVDFVPSRMTVFNLIDVGDGLKVAYTIEHPTDYPRNSDYYWQTEDEFTTGMWWSEGKTIYDPCPAGWKVPSKTEMDLVMKSGVNLAGVGFIGWPLETDFGYGNPGSKYYWTSTGDTRTNAYSINDAPRPKAGQPIRPVKEPSPATSKSVTSLTTDEIGWRIGSDGNAYSPGILPTGVTAVAMVAYLGSASDCTNGLAIALNDESGTMSQSAATTACAAKPSPVTGGAWRLTTDNDWLNMFSACGGTAEMDSNGLMTKLEAAGGTTMNGRYIMNSSSSLNRIDLPGTATFGITSNEWKVRAVLAF